MGHQPGPATDEATNSGNDREMRREVVIKIISVPGPVSISFKEANEDVGPAPLRDNDIISLITMTPAWK